MKRHAAVLFMILTTFTLVLLLAFPMTGAAIGEVTPTPGNTAPVAPTVIPTTIASTPVPTTTAPQNTPVPQAEDNPEVETLLGEAFDAIADQDFEQVITLMTEAIAIDPNDDEPYLLRGLAYVNLENYERGIDDMTRAIAIRPFDWTYHVFRGDAYVQAGEVNEALQDYGRAITMNPRYAQAYNNRSLVFGVLGDESNATLNSLMVDGLSRNGAGDFETAIARYSEVINTNTESDFLTAAAYYNRGIAYYSIGNLLAAIDDYTEAIAIDPQMHDNFLARGIAYRVNGELRNAGVDFQRRIELLETVTVNQSITRGESRELEMEYGTVYRITFEGTGGDLVTIAARDGTLATDPLIALLDPSGQAIAGDDDFGGILDSLLEDFRLPADGTYTLLVSHANGGFEGTMTLTFE